MATTTWSPPPAGKVAAAKGARKPQLLGTFAAGGMQAPTALQVLADTVAQYTPEYTASVTDIPAADSGGPGQALGHDSPGRHARRVRASRTGIAAT